MKIRIVPALAMATAGAVTLGAVLSAQSVPSQFVVSGKTAEEIQDFTTINLATARRIAEACEKLAAERGVAVSIAVLDNDGTYVYMDRMDGQGYLNVITAEMKARTALFQRGPSKASMNRVVQDPSAELQLIQLGYFPNSGGLQIVVNKQMIGVIGVGGSAPRLPEWSDEICAHKALEAVLGAANVAPLIQDLPPRANPNPPTAQAPRFASATPPKTSVSNPEWVVGAKAAANVYDANEISQAAAQKIATACREWAASKNGEMSIFILDPAGKVVHMERTDGVPWHNIRATQLKTQTALKARVPTSVYTAQGRNNPAGLTRLIDQFDFFTGKGGLPIVVDGQLIGAVGVGGGAGGDEEGCAGVGLKAVFGDHATLPVYPEAAPAAR